MYFFCHRFLVDAAKEYNMSKKVFTPIWEALDDMISSGQLLTSSEILDELKDDDLIKWIKTRKDFFVPLSKEIQEQVSIILEKYPDLIKMKSTSNSNGDPFLVATAITKSGCIVTNERLGSGNNGDVRIPNVCKGFDIAYMNLHSFLDLLLQ